MVQVHLGAKVEKMVNTKSLISSQNTIKKIVTISGYGFHTGLFSSLRLKPAEILIKGSIIKVIRKKQKYKDLM